MNAELSMRYGQVSLQFQQRDMPTKMIFDIAMSVLDAAGVELTDEQAELLNESYNKRQARRGH